MKINNPEISSISNHTFRRWKSLLGSKGIRKYGQTLVSGKKIVHEIAGQYPYLIECCIVSPKTSHFLKEVNTVSHILIADPLFRELDIFGTGYPLLVTKLPEKKDDEYLEKEVNLKLYIPFQDPSNIGAVVRTAVGFKVQQIVLLQESAHPFHPKSIRASAGAVFSAPLVTGPSIKEITKQKIPIWGLASDGKPLSTFHYPQQCGLLPGIEGPGLTDISGLAGNISVPMSGDIESLNAVVATSIALYVWSQQQKEQTV